jgi:hypothetical protein
LLHSWYRRLRISLMPCVKVVLRLHGEVIISTYPVVSVAVKQNTLLVSLIAVGVHVTFICQVLAFICIKGDLTIPSGDTVFISAILIIQNWWDTFNCLWFALNVCLHNWYMSKSSIRDVNKITQGVFLKNSVLKQGVITTLEMLSKLVQYTCRDREP